MTRSDVDFAISNPSSSFSEMTLDSTDGSALHKLPKLLVRLGFSEGFTLVALYVGAVSVTLLPLLLAGWLATGVIQSCKVQMSVFCDASTLFMFLVSFPSIVVLSVTDNQMLKLALHTVQADGTVKISQADAQRLAKRWRRLFGKINRKAQIAGLAVGLIAAFSIFWGTTSQKLGSWVVHDLTGYIFLYSITLFSALLAVYVLRSFAIAILLRDVAAHAELHMLPLHPDKAGGLKPIGRLGLRNQYALTILGLNIVLGMLTAYSFIPNLFTWILVATVFYLVVGPLVFVAPLLPFRRFMIRTKAHLMMEVALRMRVELDHVRSRLQSGPVTLDDEQMIERLRKIGAVIDDLPVWPFDAVTLRKFSAAYLAPILGSFAVPKLTTGIEILLRYFGLTITFPP